MTFTSEMFHPNSTYFKYLVFPNGDVCISILHNPEIDPTNPQEQVEEKWNPIYTIEAVIVAVNSMLAAPNLDSPANVDASVLYKENQQEFNKKARRLAEKSLGG